MARMKQTQMAQSKGQWWKMLVGIIIGAAVVGIGWYVWWAYTPPKTVEVEKIVEKEVVKEVPVGETTEAAADETEGWQVYTSDDYDYSIKFPRDLYYKGDKVQQYPGEFGAMDLIISNIENMGIQDILTSEDIHITVNTDKKSPDQSLLDYLEGKGYPQMSEISFNGVKSYLIKSGSSITVFTVNNNVVFTLTGTGYNGSASSDDLELMEKIIYTFRFSS